MRLRDRYFLFIQYLDMHTHTHIWNSFVQNQYFIHLAVPLPSQVKELKSRLADMEVQSRPSAGITLLENKIQDLEERLRSEERYDGSKKKRHL